MNGEIRCLSSEGNIIGTMRLERVHWAFDEETQVWTNARPVIVAIATALGTYYRSEVERDGVLQRNEPKVGATSTISVIFLPRTIILDRGPDAAA